ncbi:MAG TPA: aminotransferase class IV [Anaerolineales bacterium]|nr:aminotransferase class IV [Anaerolineales bacterium]
MVRTWEITAGKAREIRLKDESSLDAVTRQLPDGYYSTFRTYDACTRVIGLSAHLRRMPDLDASLLRRHLIQLLEPFGPDEARVRVMMTFAGQVYVSIEPLRMLPPDVYEKGVQVETTSIRRDSPRVKSTVFIDKSKEKRKYIAQKGVFEALLVKNGRILEGMTSNFFYVPRSADEIYSAQRDILLGVTRQTVIRVARREGIGVRYKSLKLYQLSDVREAFITSSSRGIVAVVKIDDVVVGQGRVGNITRRLSTAYKDYVIKNAEKI